MKLRHRMEFALKLSFLQAMHRMVSSSWKYMLLLHEDAVLVDNFREKLQDSLCGTPNDWQVRGVAASAISPSPSRATRHSSTRHSSLNLL